MAERFLHIANVEYLKDHEVFNIPQSAFISNTPTHELSIYPVAL